MQQVLAEEALETQPPAAAPHGAAEAEPLSTLAGVVHRVAPVVSAFLAEEAGCPVGSPAHARHLPRLLRLGMGSMMRIRDYGQQDLEAQVLPVLRHEAAAAAAELLAQQAVAQQAAAQQAQQAAVAEAAAQQAQQAQQAAVAQAAAQRAVAAEADAGGGAGLAAVAARAAAAPARRVKGRRVFVWPAGYRVYPDPSLC